MTIKNFLLENKINFNLKDLEIFLEKILNCDKNFLFLNENFLISEKNFLELKNFLEKRKKGFSVASIIGEKFFYGRKFFVDENVLIPREETEDLIDYVLKNCFEDKESFSNFKNINILDIGTGSGIIPITLNMELNKDSKNNNNFNYYGLDISEKALKIARKNSDTFKTKISFFKSDLLKDLPDNLKQSKNNEIFLITANLPYVEEKFNIKKNTSPEADKEICKTDTIGCEPDLALYSGEDGLNHYRELFEELKNVKFKFLIMEMASWQTDIIAKLYSSLGKAEIYYDLGGKKRGVFIKSF